jgi:hypothetical protein
MPVGTLGQQPAADQLLGPDVEGKEPSDQETLDWGKWGPPPTILPPPPQRIVMPKGPPLVHPNPTPISLQPKQQPVIVKLPLGPPLSHAHPPKLSTEKQLVKLKTQEAARQARERDAQQGPT